MKKSSAEDLRPKVARVYIRVSHQGERGKTPGGGDFLSPEMQLTEARNYAHLYLKGYDFDEAASITHADIDTSATRVKWQKRVGLVAHLEAARRGEFNALIVFKLSRFARSAKEGLELFDLFEQAGCSINCIKEKLDTGTAAGRLVRTILLAVAEMESENISDFVKAAARIRAAKGLVNGQPPFWVSKNGDRKYVLNERASDIRRLVELRLQGMAQTRIAKMLNSEGIQTAGGRKWTSYAVSTYLKPDRLKLMLGHYTFGVEKEESDPDRIFVENVYPAVITEDDAESLMALDRRMVEMYGSGGPRKAANTTYVLSGVLRCAACGGSMHSHTSYPKGESPRPSYECRASAEDNIPHPDGVYVSAEMVEDAVMRVVLMATLDYARQFEDAPSAKPAPTENGSAMEKRIQEITERISRLMEGYDSGMMKKEDFQPRYDKLVEERERLRAALQEKDSSVTIRFVLKEALEAVAGPRLTAEQARRLVVEIVEKVEAPVAVDPKLAGPPKAKRCRAAWITLQLPLIDGTRRVLAPMYDARFKGERVLLDREQAQ